ncbi:cytochrome P450 [Aspergillus floccosus]
MTPLALVTLAGCLMAIHAVVVFIYTLLFHPLAKYPGPLVAKFTNSYAAYHAWKGDVHLDIARCHEKYGGFVRYGPNRILVNSAAGFKDIYGSGKNVRKSSAYKALVHGTPSTFTEVDKREHSWKRRILAQAFSTSALRLLEPHILGKINRFCKLALNGDGGTLTKGAWSAPKNLSDWCSYLSFDIMTATIFGQEYDMLGAEEHRSLIKDIQRSNVRMSVLYNDNIFRFLRLDRVLFPKSMAGRRTFLHYIHLFLANSRAEEPSSTGNKSNLFHLLKTVHDPESGRQLPVTDYPSLTLPGLETTSSALAATFFYLCHNPDVQHRLAAEIRGTFHSAEDISLGPQLHGCRFLDACIQETLRMSPPAAGPIWREAQAGGAWIDGHLLPEGCDVGTSIYALHHNPRIFRNSHRFQPSRWEEDDSGMTRMGYAPFSIGPRGCVGRALGQVELALTVASVVWHYDMRLTEGDEGRVGEGGNNLGPGRDRVEEFQLYDHITAATDGPYVEFRLREA